MAAGWELGAGIWELRTGGNGELVGSWEQGTGNQEVGPQDWELICDRVGECSALGFVAPQVFGVKMEFNRDALIHVLKNQHVK